MQLAGPLIDVGRRQTSCAYHTYVHMIQLLFVSYATKTPTHNVVSQGGTSGNLKLHVLNLHNWKVGERGAKARRYFAYIRTAVDMPLHVLLLVGDFILKHDHDAKRQRRDYLYCKRTERRQVSIKCHVICLKLSCHT